MDDNFTLIAFIQTLGITIDWEPLAPEPVAWFSRYGKLVLHPNLTYEDRLAALGLALGYGPLGN